MKMTPTSEYLERLRQAINTHDLDAMIDCFADDYRNETPAHPARDFVGSAQVRQNWTQIFAGVPDIAATLVRSSTEGDTTWAEWEFAGNRRDGAAHLMRGVTVTGLRDGRAQWARFYMEPVDPDETEVGDHLRRTLASTDAPR
jgi:ketosteroid isomerase-like protein